MAASLFAARSLWIGLLLVMAGLFVAWLFVRAAIDFVTWFKEEIIDDFLDRRQNKRSR